LSGGGVKVSHGSNISTSGGNNSPPSGHSGTTVNAGGNVAKGSTDVPLPVSIRGDDESGPPEQENVPYVGKVGKKFTNSSENQDQRVTSDDESEKSKNTPFRILGKKKIRFYFFESTNQTLKKKIIT